MIASLLFSYSAMACLGGELAPLVLTPTKNYELQVDRHQEIILDGVGELPKITGIKATSPKGKPMLTVMSGLQVLENSQMKSYPHRISLKLNEMEKDWERPIEVTFEGRGKPFKMNVKWIMNASTGCAKPVVK